jgi:hypothetical protein
MWLQAIAASASPASHGGTAGNVIGTVNFVLHFDG